LASPVKEHGRLDTALTQSSLERASDERLVVLAREGVEAALEAIVRRYQFPLLDHASRFVDPDDAAPIVEQALVRSLAGIQAEPRRLALRAWLFRIVHEDAQNAARRRNLPPEPQAPVTPQVERLRAIVANVAPPRAEPRRDDVARELGERAAAARQDLRQALRPIVDAFSVDALRNPALKLGTAAAMAAVVMGGAAVALTRQTESGRVGSANPTAASSPTTAPSQSGRAELATAAPAKGSDRRASRRSRARGTDAPATSASRPGAAQTAELHPGSEGKGKRGPGAAPGAGAQGGGTETTAGPGEETFALGDDHRGSAGAEQGKPGDVETPQPSPETGSPDPGPEPDPGDKAPDPGE
jgi:DNA-directed RNA polymerase specialized sigma24 family protein